MTNHDEDGTRYFTLIVECAKVVANQRPDDMSQAEWWQDRIHGEWVHVNHILGTKPPKTIASDADKLGEYYASALGRLAREVLMAAWYFGAWAPEGNDDPEFVEWVMSEVTNKLNKST